MDCHRCVNLRYDGCPYGRCSHSGHKDVVLRKKGKGRRPYNRQICPDFRLKKSCANCRYWNRGRYFRDGQTPAARGRCSLRVVERGGDCPLWTLGPTSPKRLREEEDERVRLA